MIKVKWSSKLECPQPLLLTPFFLKLNTLPVNLEILELITDHVNREYVGLNEVQRSRFIKTLVELHLFFMVSKIKKDELQNIHSDVLKRFSFKTYRTHIQYTKLVRILELLNLVEINNRYSVDKKYTKSYRALIPIKSRNAVEMELDLDKVFSIFKPKKFYLKTIKSHRKLIEDSYRAKINIGEYSRWLNTCDISEGKKYEFLINAIKINAGHQFFTVTSTGRFYNSWANLSKTALPFVTIDGEQTICIDAKNAQPLYLTKLIRHKELKRVVESGRFYEEMMKKIKLGREETKQFVYREILFKRMKMKSSIAKLLDSRFKGLSSKIDKFKLTPLEDESTLWFKLQSIESSIWIECALSLPVVTLTRHDSIIVKIKHSELAEEMIKAKHEKKGLNVTLSSAPSHPKKPEVEVD